LDQHKAANAKRPLQGLQGQGLHGLQGQGLQGQGLQGLSQLQPMQERIAAGCGAAASGTSQTPFSPAATGFSPTARSPSPTAGDALQRAIAQLQQDMQRAASALKFEDAARLRDVINSLMHGVRPDAKTHWPGPQQNELPAAEQAVVHGQVLQSAGAGAVFFF
jgi:hypothetical protein